MTVSVVHHFGGLDPWDHLAREEIWLDELPADASALLLYVNSPCIVLGKHQNPLREVRLPEAARRGVPLLRRSSGGGTVWHDEGNLNWSLVLPKHRYDRREVSATVAQAMEPLGLTLAVGEKGDLFWNDRKVSGAAYLFRRDRVLHHGTLLCQARLDDLHGVLGPTGTLVDWVGVASRPMPVANLGLPPEAAAEALVAVWGGRGRQAGDGSGSTEFENRVAHRAQTLASDSWLWDQTPPFTWEGETRWGTIRAQVREGLIEAVRELSSPVPGRDDRNPNMSKMVGKRFFDPELFEYIPTREVV